MNDISNTVTVLRHHGGFKFSEQWVVVWSPNHQAEMFLCFETSLIMLPNLDTQGLLLFCAAWVGWLYHFSVQREVVLSLLFTIWCRVKCLSWLEALYCCPFSQNWLPKGSEGAVLWERNPTASTFGKRKALPVSQMFRIENNQRYLFIIVFVEKSLLDRGNTRLIIFGMHGFKEKEKALFQNRCPVRPEGCGLFTWHHPHTPTSFGWVSLSNLASKKQAPALLSSLAELVLRPSCPFEKLLLDGFCCLLGLF